MHKLKSFVKKKFPCLVPIVRYAKIKILQFRSVEPVFTKIYYNNFWEGKESRSGPGSNLEQTEQIRCELPILIREIGARSILDIPCGDFNWMKEVKLDLDFFIGADVVQELVGNNIKKFGSVDRHFVKLDITKDRLPQVDLVFCRDLLVHLPYRYIFKAINNLRKSNSKYLLTTTFVHLEKNEDIITGEWRELNLQKAPFCFPVPIKVINDNCFIEGGDSPKKYLGLWKIADI